MPWTVQKKGGKKPWAIMRGNKVVGRSKTKKAAKASVRARYANYKGK